jgi:predicted PurR-regulated permease PerM
MTNSSEKPGYPSSAILLRWLALIVLTTLISVLFLKVALPFLTALIMAAIAAALADPLYQYLVVKTRGRTSISAVGTLLIMLAAVIVPLIGVGYLAASQASGLAANALEIYEQISQNGEEFALPDWVPFKEEIINAWPQISAKLQELIGTIASVMATALAAMTKGTANFFLNMFIFFYAMFFFLQLERPIISQVLEYTALPPDLQITLDERIISVSRATVKGTLLIGIIQGVMGGLGFWITGIDGVAFWAVVMAIASVIPGIGATFVVFGGAIYLGMEGETAKAIGLALWAALAVGTIDNVLRPVLVGRDARMHDIFILIGTLGGLVSFGAVGLVLGPVLAGLFLTIWKTMRELSAQPGEVEIDTTAPEDQSAGAEKPTAPAGTARTTKFTTTTKQMELELQTLKDELADIKSNGKT